jgi:hypothetical protein
MYAWHIASEVATENPAVLFRHPSHSFGVRAWTFTIKMADLSEFVSSKGTQKKREQRSKERQQILDQVCFPCEFKAAITIVQFNTLAGKGSFYGPPSST